MGYKKYKSSSETYLRRAKNKKAFDAVVQYYIDVKSGSKIKVQGDIGSPHATSNPASPTPIDFTCDVDTVLKKALRTEEALDLFTQEYILEEDVMDMKEKANIEQKVGSLFVSRQLYPVKSYFRTERKASGETSKRKARS